MKHIFLVITLCLFMTACSKPKTFTFGYPSHEELTERMGRLLADKNITQFKKMVITKTEFTSLVYPHLPEAKQERPLPVEEYWNFSTYKADYALKSFFDDFKDSKSITFVKSGKPEKSRNLNDLIIYYNIPVYFLDDKGKTHKYEKIFTSVVCIGGQCRLWTIDDE